MGTHNPFLRKYQLLIIFSLSVLLVPSSFDSSSAQSDIEVGGTFEDNVLSFLPPIIFPAIRFVDGSIVIIMDSVVSGTMSGTFSGEYVIVGRTTFHPNGSTTFRTLTSCECTVEGRSGMVYFFEKGSVETRGLIISFFSEGRIIGSTDDLSNLEGTKNAVGHVIPGTILTSGTYFGDIQFVND